MVQIVNMPAFRLSGQGYDFRGINSAFNNVRQQNNDNRNALLKQDQMELQQDQFESGQDLQIERMQNAQAHQNRMLAFRDKSFLADQEYRKQQLALQRQGAGSRSVELDLRRKKLEFEIKKLKNGDPLKAAKVRLLQQLMGGQTEAAPAGQAPQLLPQSNETSPNEGARIQPTAAPINPDPNVVPVQTADGAPGQQQKSPMENLTPAQRQAMALNLVSPGMGNALLANDKGERFGKATTNKIEGKVFDTVEGSARLNNIQKSFRPEFLTMGGGIKAGWIKMVDKIRAGGMKPTAEQTKYLTDYTKFKQDAWDNLNRYIKEITGAQMSEAEASRLMRAMPNPGTSFYDGDSPNEFKAKMDNTVRQLKLAAARYTYLRSARFKGKQMVGAKGQSRISLQQMRGIMNKRASEIYNEMRRANPGMDGSLIRAQADQATFKEFGI